MIQTDLARTYPNQLAIQSLDQNLKTKSHFLVACWLAYTSIVLFFIYVMNDNSLAIKIGVSLFILCFIVTFKKVKFTANDYYSLPASKSDLAIHNCIYCGHDQVETKKSLFYSSYYCPQCKEYLYSE